MNDSSQSGQRIAGFSPKAGMADGYTMSGRGPQALGWELLTTGLGIDPRLFAHGEGYDCYYGNNYGHAELRGSPSDLFMRPSFASKHILKRSLTTKVPDADGGETSVFESKTLRYGWHGTPMRSLKSILQEGLRPSRSGAYGAGLYFSPSPLYGQLYSSKFHGDAPSWKASNGKTYFVDILLMIRYADIVNSKFESEVAEFDATIGADYCIHKLFADAKVDPPVKGRMIGLIPPSKAKEHVHLQAVVVKLHEKHPYEADGEAEWEKLRKTCKSFESSASEEDSSDGDSSSSDEDDSADQSSNEGSSEEEEEA